MRLIPLFFLFAALGSLMACSSAKRAPESASYYAPEADYDDYREESAAAAPREAPGAPMPMAAGLMADSKQSAPLQSQSIVIDGQLAAQEPAPAKRMIHYGAELVVRVNDIEASLGEATRLASELGGFVESLGANTVVLRVPAPRFDEAVESLAMLGEVLSRHLSAQDVTDAFTDTKLRLKSHRAARDRLVQLLAQARNESEKLSLLREIQRLTDLIERLDQQASTLKKLADYSRVVFEVTPRQPPGSGGDDELNAFAWMAQLSPFRAPRGELAPLELDAPAGMVALESDDIFTAEGPDGSTVRAYVRDNNPAGDTAFWHAALKRRVVEGFDGVSDVDIGAYRLVRLEEGGDHPYVWYVGVRVEGKALEVIHLYFPSAQAEARFIDAVKEALEAQGGVA